MHPYLNKNINVQIISFVIPLYMNNQKEIDGYNRNARADNPAIKDGQSTDRPQLVASPSVKAMWWKRSSTKKNMNVTLNGN